MTTKINNEEKARLIELMKKEEKNIFQLAKQENKEISELKEEIVKGIVESPEFRDYLEDLIKRQLNYGGVFRFIMDRVRTEIKYRDKKLCKKSFVFSTSYTKPFYSYQLSFPSGSSISSREYLIGGSLGSRV